MNFFVGGLIPPFVVGFFVTGLGVVIICTIVGALVVGSGVVVGGKVVVGGEVVVGCDIVVNLRFGFVVDPTKH